MKREKKMPTILGLFLLLATLYLGNSVINRQTNNVSKASGSCEPSGLQITNVTYSSATISFTTSLDCLSALSVSNQTIENPKGKSKIHYFEINSLEESKVYTFKIISDGQTYSLDSYNFKTAQKPSTPMPSSKLAWGRVYKPDKTIATQAIVYFTITGASPLSALVTSSGDWNIALATSFNESLTDYFSTPANIEENIIVIDESQSQTQIVGNTDHNNPVPDIIIGQNNFSAPTPAVELPQSNLLENSYSSDNTKSTTLTISNPKDNETISTKRPDFFGTAKPGSSLKIEVHSSSIISSTANVDNDGSWNWSPSKDLSVGEHTITVTDDNNNVISKKFIVLAAESNTSFTASASATTPTKTPTKIPSQNPTPTPTTIPVSPTRTPIPTTIPSTSSGVPRTGNTAPTLIILILSLLSITSAFIYYKKS
jgi:hypothetical protein